MSTNKTAKGPIAPSGWTRRPRRPLIDQYVQRLGSFLDAMADGRIEADELKTQEARVVALMKTVEPELERRAPRTGHASALRAVGLQHHAHDPSARGGPAQDQVPRVKGLRPDSASACESGRITVVRNEEELDYFPSDDSCLNPPADR